MNTKRHVGFNTTEVGKLVCKAINKARVDKGTDPLLVQRSWIIGFLKHSSDKIICQKDIENKFHLSKSTVTDMLTVLEKNGLVERVSVENDARRKQIILTKEGEAFSDDTEKLIDEVEECIRQGISEDDLNTFFDVLDKIKENALNYKIEDKEE